MYRATASTPNVHDRIRAIFRETPQSRPVELNLSGKPQSDRDAEHIAELLGKGCYTTLNLSNCDLSSSGVAIICAALQNNTTVEVLDLSRNEYFEDAGDAIAAMLRANRTLTTLSLSGCGMSKNSIETICEALDANHTLTNLDLYANTYKNGAMHALAATLARDTTLTSLTMGGPGDGATDGFSALCAALSLNSTLQRLVLAGMFLNDDKSSCLAEALERNSTLQDLVMDSMGVGVVVGESCGHGTSKGLRRNIGLRSLTLSNCVLSEQDAASLVEMLKNTSNRLERLHLRNVYRLGSFRHLMSAAQASTRLIEFVLTQADYRQKEDLDLVGQITSDNAIRRLPSISSGYAMGSLIRESGQRLPPTLDWHLGEAFDKVSTAETMRNVVMAGCRPPAWSLRSTFPPSFATIDTTQAPSMLVRRLEKALVTREPKDWLEAVECCLRERASKDLEWLSRRSAAGPAPCQGRAELDLHHFDLTIDDLKFLAEWTEQRLEKVPLTLNLSRNPLGDNHMPHVRSLLKAPSCVVSLDLSDCGLNKARVGSICNHLRSNTTLTSLVLSSNTCPGAGKRISGMLSRNKALRSLALSNCSLGPDSFVNIAKGLKANSALEHLDLSRNGDRCKVDGGIQMLAVTLPFGAKALRSLNLSRLSMHNVDACLDSVMTMLRDKASIDTLWLSHWNGSKDGLQRLGDFVADNKTLRHLHLASKGGGLTRPILHEGLSRNTSLITLNLAGWAFDDALAQALTSLLSNPHCSLEQLEVGKPSGQLSEEALSLLSNAVKLGKSLAKFTVKASRSNSQQASQFKEIQEHVAANERLLRTLPDSARATMKKIFTQHERTEFMPADLIGEMVDWISLIGGNSTLRNIALV